jgi:hypothetical protein
MSKGLVTRAISCAISCPICCKSQMRFAVSAIWCRTRNCYRLHVLACDMVLRYGVAICCTICCTIWCAISSCVFLSGRTLNRRKINDCRENAIYIDSINSVPFLFKFTRGTAAKQTRICTPNRRYTKSHLRFSACDLVQKKYRK